MDADQTFKALRFCQTAFTGVMGGAAMYISLIEHPARMSIQDTESTHKQFTSSFDLAARYMAIGSLFPMGGGLLAYYMNPKEGLPCAIVAGLYFVNVPYSFLFLIPNYVKPIQGDYDTVSKKYSEKQIRDTIDSWAFFHTVRTVVDVGGFLYGLYCLMYH